ncbi:MAG: hypothetical protein K0R75_3928 [Paenibacillaceae bacterium]|nr:hypothetical protein [Paenibacillaceae bacterium]
MNQGVLFAMKKLAAAALLLAASILFVACEQGKNPDAPEPYIKFTGTQVSFAENIPDCH